MWYLCKGWFHEIFLTVYHVEKNYSTDKKSKYKKSFWNCLPLCILGVCSPRKVVKLKQVKIMNMILQRPVTPNLHENLHENISYWKEKLTYVWFWVAEKFNDWWKRKHRASSEAHNQRIATAAAALALRLLVLDCCQCCGPEKYNKKCSFLSHFKISSCKKIFIIPYMCHYNSRLVYLLPHFSLRLIL